MSFDVDAVLECTADSIRGLRHVPASLDIFTTHFPRFPVLPGVLVMAALSELAEHLLVQRTGSSWRLASASRIRFIKYVKPGDSLLIEVRLVRLGEAEAELAGEASVGSERVASARTLRLVGAG